MDVNLFCSNVFIQTGVQGSKTGLGSLALSEPSENRKRTRTSLPANGVGGRSVSKLNTSTFSNNNQDGRHLVSV